MSINLFQHSVSVKANLRKQVKRQRCGRSQNEELARGMAV